MSNGPIILFHRNFPSAITVTLLICITSQYSPVVNVTQSAYPLFNLWCKAGMVTKLRLPMAWYITSFKLCKLWLTDKKQCRSPYFIPHHSATPQDDPHSLNGTEVD